MSYHVISSHLIASHHISFLLLKETTMKPKVKPKEEWDWVVVHNRWMAVRINNNN